jgi:hypothetical protein
MLAVPGSFASNNPRSVVLAGGGFFVAGDDGLTVARFAWADPLTGRAANAYGADALLGFVQPVAGAYRRLSVENGVTVRPGYPVTLFAAGDFYVRFDAGAQAGQPVYASLLDGSAISGQSDDAILTPWYVVTNCGPGETAVISTWSIPQ